ncbi:MAG: hypothetical protein R3F22_09855 [Lysobacteraceae bacterium]
MQPDSIIRYSRIAAVLIGAATFPAGVLAQDKIVFKVAGDAAGTEFPVDIEEGTTVLLDEDGNFQVTCKQDTTKSTAACIGIGDDSGPSGDAAEVATFVFQTGGTISNNGTTATIAAEDSLGVTMAWTVSNAPAACIATGNRSVSGWNGDNVSPSGGSFSTTVSNTGESNKTYTFTLECFNESGSAGAKTITAIVAPRTQEPPPLEGECTITKAGIADPVQRALFQPSGYTQVLKTWAQAFNGNDYPNSWGAHYPVGSWTMDNATILGKYLSIPFTADTVFRHKLEWIPAVSIAQLPQYRPRPATGAFVTISPCAGDFRTSTATSGPAGDETMRSACRIYDDAGSIYFGQYVNTSTCPIVAGKVYYLNIAFADPRDSVLSPTESTCDAGAYWYSPGVCDAEFYMRN